jgi:hypothetical protein
LIIRRWSRRKQHLCVLEKQVLIKACWRNHPKYKIIYPTDYLRGRFKYKIFECSINKLLWSISEISRLIHLPECLFWKFVVKCRRSLIFHGLISSIVLDLFVIPLIISKIEAFWPCFSYFVDEIEHDPCSGIKVADR